MTLLVPIALFGWIPVVLLIFTVLPAQRAAIVSFVLGWMVLPVAGYRVPVLHAYDKTAAVSLAVLIATSLFDSHRLLSLRFSLLDLPMVVWCLCPFFASIANGLGPYDGCQSMLGQVILWGVPYYLGRVYVRSLSDLREVALWLFIGGLIYIPLCWFEIRMSPQLSRWIYGFGDTGAEYEGEFGKWGSRPRVFMGNGIMLGTFMTAASVVGFGLWSRGNLKRVAGVSAGWLVFFLIVTSIACKNVGALSLLALGIAALVVAKRFRTFVVVWLVIFSVPLYIGLRATGSWSGDQMIHFASMLHQRRADSIKCRLDNEDLLVAKALQRPAFGWGGWGRARIYRTNWRGELKDISVTDGLWVLALGDTGLLGLAAISCVYLLPAASVLRRYSADMLRAETRMAPAEVLVVWVVLCMADNLFNAMPIPIYIVAVGGLSSLAAARSAASIRRAVMRPSGPTRNALPGTSSPVQAVAGERIV